MTDRVEFRLPDGFTSEVRAHPAYDTRDQPDGAANGLEFIFILRGPAGAISWELMTGIMERPVQDAGWSVFDNRPPRRGSRPGLDYTRATPSGFPIAGPVASHVPDSVEYLIGPAECNILPGGRCWQNIGYLIGDRVLAALVACGDPGVWRELLDIYRAWIEGSDD